MNLILKDTESNCSSLISGSFLSSLKVIKGSLPLIESYNPLSSVILFNSLFKAFYDFSSHGFIFLVFQKPWWPIAFPILSLISYFCYFAHAIFATYNTLPIFFSVQKSYFSGLTSHILFSGRLPCSAQVPTVFNYLASVALCTSFIHLTWFSLSQFPDKNSNCTYFRT